MEAAGPRDLYGEHSARSVFFRPQEVVVMDCQAAPGDPYSRSSAGAGSASNASSVSSNGSLHATWQNLSGAGGVDGGRGLRQGPPLQNMSGLFGQPAFPGGGRAPAAQPQPPPLFATDRRGVPWDLAQQQRYDQSRAALAQVAQPASGGQRRSAPGGEWAGDGGGSGGEHAAEKLYHTRVSPAARSALIHALIGHSRVCPAVAHALIRPSCFRSLRRSVLWRRPGDCGAD